MAIIFLKDTNLVSGKEGNYYKEGGIYDRKITIFDSKLNIHASSPATLNFTTLKVI
jgi:hypothetical protein